MKYTIYISSVYVCMSYLARVRSAAVTPPSATAFTWARAALITWRDRIGQSIHQDILHICADEQAAVTTMAYSHHQQRQPGKRC